MCLSVSVMLNGLYRYGYYSFWLGYSIQSVPTEVKIGNIKISVGEEKDEAAESAENAEKPASSDIESSAHQVEELLIHLKCKELLRKEVFAIRDSISRYIRYCLLTRSSYPARSLYFSLKSKGVRRDRHPF